MGDKIADRHNWGSIPQLAAITSFSVIAKHYIYHHAFLAIKENLAPSSKKLY